MMNLITKRQLFDGIKETASYFTDKDGNTPVEVIVTLEKLQEVLGYPRQIIN